MGDYSKKLLVLLAQLVEHLTFNEDADGSNPSQDTNYKMCGGSSVG